MEWKAPTTITARRLAQSKQINDMNTLVSGNMTSRTATTAAQLAPVAASAGMKEVQTTRVFQPQSL